ncbi:MAG TPA: leader peptide processing enzyme [Termitinemataceae bacterium]|nr:leader peptide processing enzyme [Termitinemataceae bacterium]HOM22186.1 leader peptide processing enzyme [Termitinemataceae bacterium]HPP99392.1 leader peptide processing enzyme [Termitinemataceae bacterium]
MNKKANTIFFMLGATIFNVVITVVSFVILLVIYGKWIVPLLPAESAPMGLPLVFVGAIVVSFVVYRLALKWFMKRVDVDKHFDPLFRSKRSVRRD